MKKNYFKIVFTLLFLIYGCFFQMQAYGAWFNYLPTTVTQPDGSEIKCFASGDEFYNWIHDSNGFTIIMGKDGYYYYGKSVGNEITPTTYRVGIIDPLSVGLSHMEKISKLEYEKRRALFYEKMNNKNIKAPSTGLINNIVVYIKFSDQQEFTVQRSVYDEKFNSENNVSLRNYYNEVSYNLLDIQSTHYPICEPTTNLSFTDSHPRSYYEPFHLLNNPNGYLPEQRESREHSLLSNAINFIASDVPSSLELDQDSDGNVDNVCFIIGGAHGNWNELLWAHRWTLFSLNVNINGNRVFDYTFQPEDQNDVQTICHEMFHSLGAPDLYHYEQQGIIRPVGPWDLMESGFGHMGAYMKWRYSNQTWIANIPEITVSGTYSLNPLSSQTNNVFRINSSNTNDEYFIVEYRRDTGNYESNLPGSGLLVYRINPSLNGNASGPPDEVYIYRPNGTNNVNGNVSQAHFSSSVNRTEINDETNPTSFLGNGQPGGLKIKNITAANQTISFDVVFEGVQVALVIDRSGSMAGSYITGAKNASKSFVDFMQLNDFLAVTSFSSSASVNFPFTQITSEQIKTNAKNAINGINATGSTSIGAGLQKAQQQLNLGNTDKSQGIILLSDGYENEYPYVSQVLPTIPGNTDIYTIALGPDSDQTLLNNIASNTGGFYSYSPSTTRLALIYNSIRAKVTGQQVLAWILGLIAQGQNIFHDVFVDAGATLVNFSLTWPGSDLDLVLIDPNGTQIDHNTTDPNISFSSGPTYENYSVLNPVPGKYTLKVTGVSVTGQEPYNVIVTGESTLKMDVAFNKSVYGMNEPILVTADIKDGDFPVTGATVSAEVTIPSKSSYLPKGTHTDKETGTSLMYDNSNGNYFDESGKVLYYRSDLILYDDGLHGDGSANDGVYGNYFTNTAALGSYSFDISASGVAPVSGSFTRLLSKSTTVTSTQSIVVTEPQTGTNWYANSYQTVQWSSTNIIGNVDIYLSTNGGSTFTIPLALNTTDDGIESFLIPQIQSATCRIKVQSVNYSTVYGTNPGNFSILKPVLSIVPDNITVPPLAGSATFDIQFSNQAQTAWSITNLNDWISVSPLNGSGEFAISLNYELNTSEFPRSGTITVTAPDSQNGVVNITVTQERNPNQCAQTIDIPLNWSAISSFIIPENPDLDVVFSEIQEGVVIMVGKSGIYWPGQNINTIGNWNAYNGYKIKMSEAASLCMNGEMPVSKTVNLLTGVNYLPVLDDQNVVATDIFNQVSGQLLFAFDILNNLVYWPAGGLYTLQTLEPGKGYLVSMTAAASVTFPETVKSSTVNANKIQVIENSPWTVENTGVGHIISIEKSALSELNSGDIIAAFNSSGLCVGRTQLTGANENLPLVVYGDDFTTSAIDGMLENEAVTFKVYNASNREVSEVNPVWDMAMPNADQFAENGLSAITSLKASTSIANNDLSYLRISPNPSNGLFNIFGINEAVTISVLNTTGQILDSFNADKALEVDLSNYAKGIYYLKIVSGNSVRIEKVIVK